MSSFYDGLITRYNSEIATLTAEKTALEAEAPAGADIQAHLDTRILDLTNEINVKTNRLSDATAKKILIDAGFTAEEQTAIDAMVSEFPGVADHVHRILLCDAAKRASYFQAWAEAENAAQRQGAVGCVCGL